MVEWPNSILRAGWDKCLCPDCIWEGHLLCILCPAFVFAASRTLRVKWVWRSATNGFQVQNMLQDLALGALWVRVQDKTSQDTSLLQRSVCLFCKVAQVHPLSHTRQQDTNPSPINNGSAHNHPAQVRYGLSWANKELVFSSLASPTVVPPSGACAAPSTSMGPGPRGTKGEPSSASSTAGPQGIHHPTSSSPTLGWGRPSSKSPPITTS